MLVLAVSYLTSFMRVQGSTNILPYTICCHRNFEELEKAVVHITLSPKVSASSKQELA
jgi:hypothetical protein